MARTVTANIYLTDADETAYAGLGQPDRKTFLVAKLAASFAPALLTSLANTNILAQLSVADQTAIGNLIAAVKAVP